MNGGARRVVLGLACVAVLAGCSGAGQQPAGPSPTPESSPESSPGSSSPGGAYSSPLSSSPVNPRHALRTQAEIDAAVAAMPRTLGFTVTYTSLSQGPFVETRGVYSRPDRWSSRTDVRSLVTGEKHVMRTRSTGSSQWMQVEGWVGRVGCWMELGPIEPPLGHTFLTAGRPVPVQLLPELRRTSRGYALPYRMAVAMRTLPLIEEGRLVEVDDLETPVRVSLQFLGARLRQVTIRLKDVLAALPRRHPGHSQVRNIADVLVITIRFAAGTSAPEPPPPPATVFTEEEQTCRPPMA